MSFKLSRSKQEHDELFVGEVMIERGGCFRSSHMGELNKMDRNAIQESLTDDTAPRLVITLK